MATGSDATMATGDVTNTLKEKPNGVTILRGEADFTAEGTGAGATATASSGVNVTGADYVIETTINYRGGSSTDATAESITKYVAIDIPGWSPPGGEKVIQHVINLPYMPAHSSGSDLPSGTSSTHSTIAVEAVGEHPLTVVANQAHAVGGHLSSLSTWALVAD
jgi:hypothetical protein